MVKSFLGCSGLAGLAVGDPSTHAALVCPCTPAGQKATLLNSFLFCFLLKRAEVTHAALLHLLQEWTEELGPGCESSTLHRSEFHINGKN